MKIAIISHTEHYCGDDGIIVGWGPTVREINHLAAEFEMIYHIAPLHDGLPPTGSMCYEMDNIRFIPLRPSGGDSLSGKLSVITNAWHNVGVVRKTLKDVDCFQFRAPTGMGVYMLPWLYLFSGTKGWSKYAGNWTQRNPPLAYAFQRWMLQKNKKHKVTINGEWPNQPKHCLSFENPCLTLDERKVGKEIIIRKDYSGVLNFCFIGRLEEAKGVGLIIEAFKLIGINERIGKIHFIGDGPDRQNYLCQATPIIDKCVFHGFVKRTDIKAILAECHLFLLPSESEGFPKAIAEAANYGCIPIVSDVSCIGQYVKNGYNGYLIPEENRTAMMLVTIIEELLLNHRLSQMAEKAWDLSEKFTFEYYIKRIKFEVAV